MEHKREVEVTTGRAGGLCWFASRSPLTHKYINSQRLDSQVCIEQIFLLDQILLAGTMMVGEDQTGADTTHQARNSKGCGPLFLVRHNAMQIKNDKTN